MPRHEEGSADDAWDVSGEMFDSILAEVEEETGVPRAALSDPVLIGVGRRRCNARSAMFFHVECSLSAAEVEHAYAGAEDKFESRSLLFVTRAQLAEMQATPGEMPGCHRAGADLFRIHCEHRECAAG